MADLRGTLFLPPSQSEIFGPTHKILLIFRHAVDRLMFELGRSGIKSISERALELATENTTDYMTVSEKMLALFEHLRSPVFRFLLRKTQDATRAEDLTQETFLRLFRHLQDEGSLENAKAWLFTVANNLAIDEGRREFHVKDLDESSWTQIENSRAGGQADPEKLLLQQERLDRLHVAVLKLTPLQRECLHLRAEGMRYREIAGILELSMSTVVDAVRRATVKLAREFEVEASS